MKLAGLKTISDYNKNKEESKIDKCAQGSDFNLKLSLSSGSKTSVEINLKAKDFIKSNQLAIGLPDGNICRVAFVNNTLLVDTQAKLDITLETKLDLQFLCINTNGTVKLKGESCKASHAIVINAPEFESSALLSSNKVISLFTDIDSLDGKINLNNKIQTPSLIIRAQRLEQNSAIEAQDVDLKVEKMHQSKTASTKIGKMQDGLESADGYENHKLQKLRSSKLIVIEEFKQDQGANNEITHSYICLPDQSCLAGENKFKSVVFDHNDLYITGNTKIVGSLTNGSEAAIVQNQGQLEFEGCVLDNFECDNRSMLKITTSKINGEGINQTLDGSLELQNIKEAKINSLVLAGSLHVQNAMVETTKLSFEASGFGQRYIIEDSDFSVSGLFSSNPSTELEIMGGVISAKEIDLNGSCEIDDSAMTAAERFNVRGHFNSENSQLICAKKLTIDTPETVSIKNTLIKSASYTTKAKIEYEKCEIESDFYQQAKKAVYKDSMVKAKNFLDIKRDTATERSLLVCEGQFVTSAYLDAQAAEFRSQFYEQRVGDFNLHESSLQVAKAISLNSGTRLNSGNSTVTSDKIYNNGEVKFDSSQLTTNEFLNANSISAQSSNFEVKERLFIARHTVLQSKTSILMGKTANLIGRIELSDEAQLCFEQLKIMVGGLLEAQSTSVINSRDLDIDGAVRLDQAKVITKDINLSGGKLQSSNSQVEAREKLELSYGAMLDMNTSKLAADIMCSESRLIANNSSIIVEHDIDLESMSRSELNGGELQTGDLALGGKLALNTATMKSQNMYIKRGAEINGQNGKLNVSHSLSVDGQVQVDNLQIVADKVYVPGVLDGGKNLNIVADQHLHVQGEVTAQSTIIDANHVTVEMGGAISGKKQLDVTSLTTTLVGGSLEGDNIAVKAGVMTNLGGSILGYNQNIDSMVDVNLGLSVPILPNDPSDILTTDKLATVGKTLLSNVCRPASTAVNLLEKSQRLVTVAKKAADNVQNQTSKAWEEQRLRHYIRTALDVKSVAISAQSLGNEMSSAGQQISTGLEHAKNLAEGKESPAWQMPDLNQAAIAVAEAGMAAIAPSTNRQSLFSADMGVTASYTVSEQNAFSIHTGATMGHDVRVQTAFNQYNFGSYEANTLNLEAQKHFNYGSEHAKEKLILTVQEGHVGKGAVLKSDKTTDVNITNDFSTDGKIDLTGGKVNVGRAVTVGTDGQLQMQGLNFKANNLEQQGNTIAVQGSKLDIKQVSVVDNGNLTVDQSSKQSTEKMQLHNRGVYNLRGTGNIDQLNMDDKSQANITGALQANRIDNQSNFIVSNAGNVTSENYTAGSKSSTTLENQASFVAQNTELNGVSEITDQSLFHVEQAKVLGGSHTVYGKAKYIATNTNLSGGAKFEVQKNAMAFGSNMQITDKSELKIDGILAKGLVQSVDENGKPIINVARMENLEIEEQGTVNISGSLAAQQVTNRGTVDLANAAVDAGKYDEEAGATTKMRQQTSFATENSNFAGNSSFTEGSTPRLGNTSLASSGNMQLSGQAKATATNFKQDGKLELSNAAIGVNKLDQGSTALLGLVSGGYLVAQQAELKGTTDATSNSFLDLKQSHTHKGAKINLSDGARYTGEDGTHDGEINVQQYGVYNVNNNVLQQQATLNIEKGAAALMHQVTLKEESKMNNAGLVAKSMKNVIDESGVEKTEIEKILEINVERNSHFNSTGTTYADNLNNWGTVDLSQGYTHIHDLFNNTDATVAINDKAILNTERLDNAGSILLKQAALNARSGIVRSGGLNRAEDNSSLHIDEGNIEHGGREEISSSIRSGKNLVNEGVLKTDGSKVITKVKKTIGEQEVEVDEVSYTTQLHFENEAHNKQDGNMDLSGTYFKAKNITNDGKARAKDLYIKSDRIENKGDINYFYNLNIEADHLQTSEQSSLRGQDQSHFGLQANTSDNKGCEDHFSTAQTVKQMSASEAKNLLQGTGKHANKNVRNDLHVATDTNDAMVLDQHNRKHITTSLKTAGNITNTAEYSGKGLSLESTTGNIHMQRGATAEGDISLKAAGDINKQGIAIKSEHGNAILNAGGKVDNSNGGLISANEGIASIKGTSIYNNSSNADNVTKIEGKFTKVEATQGNIENRGGIIGSTVFTQVKAAGDVINTSVEKREWRGHDHSTVYQQGVIAGGKGNEDTKNVGLQIEAGGKVINEASAIVSSGTTLISAVQGVESTAKASTYIANKDKRHHGALNQTKHEVEEQAASFGKSMIAGDKVVINSEQGGVRLHGTDNISQNGTLIDAKKDVVLESAVQKTVRKERKEELWGLLKKKKVSEQQNESLTVLANTNQGEIKVRSQEGGIKGQGVLLMGTKDTDLVLQAKQDINISARNLQNKMREHSVSADLSVAGQSIVNPHSGGNFGDRLAKADPTAAALKQFMGSENPLEAGVNMYNAAAATANLGAELATNGPMGAIQNRLGATLSVTETDTTMKYETEGEGGVHNFKKVTMHSETGDVNLGVNFSDIDKMKVTANTFNVHNNELHHSSETKTHSASVGFGAAGWNGGASASRDKATGVTQTQRTGQVGELELDVNKFKLDGAQLECNDITGRADEIETIDKTNKQTSSHQSANVNSSGGFSVADSKANSEEMGARGGLHVKNGINKPGCEHHLAVKKHTNYGGEGVTTDNSEDNKLYEQGVETHQHDLNLHNTRTGGSIGVSGKTGDPNSGRLVTIGFDMQDYRSVMKKDGLHETKHDRFKASIALEDPTKTFGIPVNDPESKKTQEMLKTEESKQNEVEPIKEVGLQSDGKDQIEDADNSPNDKKKLENSKSNTKEKSNKEPDPVLFNKAAKNASKQKEPTPDKATNNNDNTTHTEKHQKAKAEEKNKYDEEAEGVNAKDAGKFAEGFAWGAATAKAAELLAKTKLGAKVLGVGGAVGAGLLATDALKSAYEFERDNFMYTEEFDQIMANPMISDDKKLEIYEDALNRQQAAEQARANQPSFTEKFKENATEWGAATGGLFGAFSLWKKAPNAVAAASEARAVEEETISLFRAVGPNEAKQIENTGKLENIFGIENKYFSTSYDSVRDYARMAENKFGDPLYKIIETKIPKNTFDQLPQHTKVDVDGGIPAVVLPTDLLEKLTTPSFIDTFKLPKPNKP